MDDEAKRIEDVCDAAVDLEALRSVLERIKARTGSSSPSRPWACGLWHRPSRPCICSTRHAAAGAG